MADAFNAIASTQAARRTSLFLPMTMLPKLHYSTAKRSEIKVAAPLVSRTLVWIGRKQGQFKVTIGAIGQLNIRKYIPTDVIALLFLLCIRRIKGWGRGICIDGMR